VVVAWSLGEDVMQQAMASRGLFEYASTVCEFEKSVEY